MLWYSLEEAPQFSYFFMKTCFGYSLEAPQRGASNEYPQHMFSWRNKKNINTFGLKNKVSFLELCISAEGSEGCSL